MPLPSFANVPSLVSLALKLTNSEDPMFKKSFPLWHVLFVPLIAVYHNGICSPLVSIDPQSLSTVRPLLWPVALTK